MDEGCSVEEKRIKVWRKGKYFFRGNRETVGKTKSGDGIGLNR